jgi:hypothetical protein
VTAAVSQKELPQSSAGRFDVGSTAGVRQIPLSDAAVKLLVEWRVRVKRTEPESLMFSTWCGKPISPNSSGWTRTSNPPLTGWRRFTILLILRACSSGAILLLPGVREQIGHLLFTPNEFSFGRHIALHLLATSVKTGARARVFFTFFSDAARCAAASN